MVADQIIACRFRSSDLHDLSERYVKGPPARRRARLPRLGSFKKSAQPTANKGPRQLKISEHQHQSTKRRDVNLAIAAPTKRRRPRPTPLCFFIPPPAWLAIRWRLRMVAIHSGKAFVAAQNAVTESALKLVVENNAEISCQKGQSAWPPTPRRYGGNDTRLVICCAVGLDTGVHDPEYGPTDEERRSGPVGCTTATFCKTLCFFGRWPHQLR